MGRRRNPGGRGHGNAAAKNSPPDSEARTSTPPPGISDTEAGNAAGASAEVETKATQPATMMPSAQPAQEPVAAEMAAGDGSNTAGAVAALNAYAYQRAVNATTTTGIVVEDDTDNESAPTVDSTVTPVSPPRVSGKKVVFTSAVSVDPLSEKKLREARCVESVCTYCSVV
ncbi:hypothetical protein Q4I28_001124 [Leishmania naiffi]|uniref:Uncharacterized protein n=1 Tax=Leishmania naiffi TaxID=5678 RepID=A0AAW3C6W0_9TRYP